MISMTFWKSNVAISSETYLNYMKSSTIVCPTVDNIIFYVGYILTYWQ